MTDATHDIGMRRASVFAVLDFAWAAGVFTVSEAMTATSLTRSTTIDALDALVRARVLRELPNARAAGEYRVGRPARRFELPGDLGMVAGLHVRDTQFTLRIADLGGRTLSHRHVSIDPDQTVGQLQRTLMENLDSACADSGIAPDALMSICVGHRVSRAAAGESRSRTEGRMERTNHSLADLLSSSAGVVEIKNDAQLAAIAEAALGEAVGSRDYIALLGDERLCAGVVVDGHLLHGAHGSVGERLVLDVVSGFDSTLGLGPAIEKRARQLLADGELDPAGCLAATSLEELDARRILVLAADGKEDALRIAAGIGESLARLTGILSSMFDPERIVVCGAIAESIEPVLEAARRSADSNPHSRAPVLIRSRLGAEVVVLGAVTRAIENARDTIRLRLLSPTVDARREPRVRAGRSS